MAIKFVQGTFSRPKMVIFVKFIRLQIIINYLIIKKVINKTIRLEDKIKIFKKLILKRKRGFGQIVSVELLAVYLKY